MNVFVILVTEWFNSRECLTFQYLPNNPSTYVVYLQFILKSIPLNIWDQLSRFKHEQQIWLTHETCLMKNHILLFSCFRLTCSSMFGLFLWVARSHGGHVADGDLIGEYRIMRHSLELNHSVTKITTFICIHLCFSRNNMHLWIMIDTGDICYGITVSMSVNFIYVETLPFNQHDLNTWIFLCLFKNELEVWW